MPDTYYHDDCGSNDCGGDHNDYCCEDDKYNVGIHHDHDYGTLDDNDRTCYNYDGTPYYHNDRPTHHYDRATIINDYERALNDYDPYDYAEWVRQYFGLVESDDADMRATVHRGNYYPWDHLRLGLAALGAWYRARYGERDEGW